MSDMAVKVHIAMLVQHSEVLRDMFSIPHPKNAEPENAASGGSGTTQMDVDVASPSVHAEGTIANPINLYVTIEELEDVVGWLYR
jgi:hypothetical protein